MPEKDFALGSLLPVQLCEPIRFGPVEYRFEGVESRPLTESEVHAGGGRAWLHHGTKRVGIVLESEAGIYRCPAARWLVGLHELGHLVNGDTGPALSVRSREVTVASQEAAAWPWAEAYATVKTGKRLLAECVRCVHTQGRDATGCPHSSVGGLVEGLRETEVPLLADLLAEAIRQDERWFGVREAVSYAPVEDVPGETTNRLRIREDRSGRVLDPGD